MAQEARTVIYTHTACLHHRPGPGHPEAPARLEAVLAALRTPEFDAAQWREAPRGEWSQVLRVHTGSNRPGSDAYRHIGPRPAREDKVPDHVLWDLWIGTAPHRLPPR